MSELSKEVNEAKGIEKAQVLSRIKWPEQKKNVD
jgi:hypothetical protein